MPTTPATHRPDQAGPEPQLAIVLLAPEASRRDATRLVVLGVVTLAAGAFLIVMFASLARGGSASPWGPINDLLGAAGNVLLAVLLPRLSRGAARTGRARGFVGVVTAASLVAAASGVLLVARVLPFEPSTAISMVAIVLQASWMAWLNTAWRRDPRLPRTIWLTGASVGYGLLAGLGLVGASFLFPWGSAPSYALLIPGVALGGAIWLAWPIWYLRLGRRLRRLAEAAPN